MPAKPLPSNPSLAYFKHQAENLLKAAAAGDPDTIGLIREFHPHSAGHGEEKFLLSEAQLVTARVYGFANWESLRTCTEAIRAYGSNPQDEHGAGNEDPADAFLRFVCLTYGSDHPSRREKARAILALHPEIRSSSLHVAAALGDAESAARILEKHPESAKERGGPFRWEPLLYLTYSRFSERASQQEPAGTARLLLARGADPNAGFLWDRSTCLFTALTGVFGEGEAGPVNQPPHPCEDILARLLLTAGADPNDGQTLYNRQFTPGGAHLKLLLAHGLGKPSRGPWHERLGGRLQTPAELLRGQLFWAAEHGHIDRAELLAGQDIDLNARNQKRQTAYELAMRNGHLEIARLLADRGADRMSLSADGRFEAACKGGHRDEALSLLRKHPELLVEFGSRGASMLAAAAGANQLDAARLMLELGFSVNTPNQATALHQAAWFGHLEMARLLVGAGADPSLRDPSHNARPVDWARYNQKTEVAEYLEAMDRSDAPSNNPGSGSA